MTSLKRTKNNLKQQSVINESGEPSTEDIYCQAIDEAGDRLIKTNRQLKEEQSKNEVLKKLMNEMKLKLEGAESRVNMYEKTQSKRTINKERISNKINKIFEKRDEHEEQEIKKIISKYEEELRKEYRI